MNLDLDKFALDVKKSIRHSIINICKDYGVSEANMKYNLNLDIEIPINVCDEVKIEKGTE